MIRARLAFGLLSGLALLSVTGCGGGLRLRPAAGYDLQIDASTSPASAPAQGIGVELLIVVTQPRRRPRVPAPNEIVVEGSMTLSTGDTFTSWAVVGTGWACTGTWAAFRCAKMLTARLRNEQVRLVTSYLPQPPGTALTYTVGVSMTGNTDPDSTHDSYTFTYIL